MVRYVRFCDDLVRLFSPVHAEIYDYVSAIPCTATENMLVPAFPISELFGEDLRGDLR